MPVGVLISQMAHVSTFLVGTATVHLASTLIGRTHLVPYELPYCTDWGLAWAIKEMGGLSATFCSYCPSQHTPGTSLNEAPLGTTTIRANSEQDLTLGLY